MTLTVLYDSSCELCRRSRAWLEREPCYDELVFVAASSVEARRRFGALPWLGSELIVVGEEGTAWVGPAAFLMCLYATRRWRSLALQLSRPALLPLARVFFQHLSRRRGVLGPAADCTDGSCDAPAHAHETGPVGGR